MKIIGFLFVIVAVLTGCGGGGGLEGAPFAAENTTLQEPAPQEPTPEEPTPEEPTPEEPILEKWTIHSEIPFDRGVNKAFIDTDYLYVAASSGGAKIIDASNVSEPETVWSITPSYFGSRDNFLDVIVTRNLAIFIANPGCTGLCQPSSHSARIYEKTDPAEPVLMDSFALHSSSLGANENLLYAATSVNLGIGSVPELKVIDLSDPGNSEIVGSVEISGGGQLAVRGQLAYVSFNGLQGFRDIDAINIADPDNPVMLGNFGSGAVNVRHSPIALSGDTAYIADLDGGVQVVDITDPVNMQLLANIPTPSDANDVAVADGYLYVAQDTDGVAIYDIDIPTEPMFVQYIDTPAPALSISVSERIGVVSIEMILDERGFIVAPEKLLLFLTQ